jgi:hypothetical protein
MLIYNALRDKAKEFLTATFADLFVFADILFIPRSVDRFFYITDHTISLFTAGLDFTSGSFQHTTKNSMKPLSYAIFCNQPQKFMQIYATMRIGFSLENSSRMFEFRLLLRRFVS